MDDRFQGHFRHGLGDSSVIRNAVAACFHDKLIAFQFSLRIIQEGLCVGFADPEDRRGAGEIGPKVAALVNGQSEIFDAQNVVVDRDAVEEALRALFG